MFYKKVNFKKKLFEESNIQFLDLAYRQLLGRKVDEHGKNSYLKALSQSLSREEVILSIAQSQEFRNRILEQEQSDNTIQPIIGFRPDSYKRIKHLAEIGDVLTFNIDQKKDFDWIEKMILENCYYEKIGIWTFDIDNDKRLMAEVISNFFPKKVLEIGCSSGSIIKCLTKKDIDSYGLDISKLAFSHASPEIKNRIFLTDLLDFQTNEKYDCIFGLDIFEHLNPNKLEKYITKIYSLLQKNGFLYCNIPAFGKDEVFGEIFPIYLKSWFDDANKKTNFKNIHVDNYGFPLHGHLIWACYDWWVEQFVKVGFNREIEIEKEHHTKFDKDMSLGRKSFFIFSKAIE